MTTLRTTLSRMSFSRLTPARLAGPLAAGPLAPSRLCMCGLALLTLMASLALTAGPALAAGEKAMALRRADGLIPFTPPEKFLDGDFIADETDPTVIFGTVKAFAASRACPVTWLIEEGEKARLARVADQAAPVEYTLYLEEDCPDKVVHYVFIDQSVMSPKQLIDWRQQFHKSKVEHEFATAKERLEKALADGVAVAGELRFVMRNGELQGRPLEEALRTEYGFAPKYDLKQGRKLP